MVMAAGMAPMRATARSITTHDAPQAKGRVGGTQSIERSIRQSMTQLVPPILMRRNRQRLALALTAMLALVIALLTLVPLPASDLPGSDKHYHVVAFAALIVPTAVLLPRLLCIIGPVIFGYGVLIEVLQPLVGRESDVMDAAANALGLAAGAVIGLILHRLVSLSVARSTRIPS